MNSDQDNSRADHISLLDIAKAIPSLAARGPRALRAIKTLNRNNKFLSLGSVIENAAASHPNKTFIHFEQRRISYKEFNDRSNKIAHYLDKQGIRKGEVVSLLFDNRPEFLICAVAVVKLGAIASLLNPSQKGQVLLHSVNLVKSKAIIVGEELIDSYEGIRSESLVEDAHHYFVADQALSAEFLGDKEGFSDLIEASHPFAHKRLNQLDKVHRKDSCFYIYTSGTTGMPKASITNHDRWLAAYAGLGHGIVQLKSDDTFYCPLPFYHATAMLVCWGSIIAGRSALLLKRKFSASEFWDDVEKYDVTAFGYVGELCRYLLNQEPSAKDQQHKIRVAVGNGLRPSSWKAFKERFGVQRIVEFYAASEGNVGFINLFNLDNTIGIGSHNLALVKYDKENEQVIRNNEGFLEKVEPGEAGLLLGKIDDITPFPGYTDKNQTKKTIISDVFVKGDQWFNTGDLVKNIGFRHYQFVDRLGDTFRWKGENVSTTELENIAMKHAHIEDCIAYGVEIPETNGRAGMISIQLSESVSADEFDPNSLLDYFVQNLPSYAVPRFIRLKNSLETTGTFKHKKSDLKNEAFDIELVKDKLFALLPVTEQKYYPIDEAVHTKILNGFYQF